MKATQVKAKRETFKTPHDQRAAKCAMCGRGIQAYYGISGKNRYCDWKCKLKAHERKEHY